MSDTFAPLVTSGGRRGCGYRQPGAAYLAVPLGEFLIDPPVVVDDPGALGLTSIGTTMIERGGITHVLDIVGREHYPTVLAFVDEARRMGISRRISRNSDFSKITPASRLLLLHPHADIANAPEFPTSEACPCQVPEHVAEGFTDMCARLWALEPLDAAQHRLAMFASFPIPQIELVRDPVGGTHSHAMAAAASAGVPVVEVDR